MKDNEKSFQEAFDVLQREFGRLVRELVDQQAKSFSALGRDPSFQKSATPYVSRNKIYSDTVKAVGNAFVNAVENILIPNTDTITHEQTRALITELNQVINSMRERARRGTSSFASSTGRHEQVHSMTIPLDSIYLSAASTFSAHIDSIIRQSNLKKRRFAVRISKVKSETSHSEKIHVFFSHSTADKKRVMSVADMFEQTRFEVFVAHKDIPVSSVWREEIIKNLRDCDVIVSFLTGGFRGSNWTDQEMGIAIGQGRAKIIALQFNEKPYGFLEQYQCLNCKRKTSRDIAQSIVKAILSGSKSSDSVRAAFFNSLATSISFDQSIMFSNLLSEFTNYSDSEFVSLVQGACKNDQISNSPRTVSNISRILEKYRERLSDQLIADYENKVALLEMPK